MHEVTRILSAVDQGDPQAAEQLLPLVYDELRKLAAQKLAQDKPSQTLQATALVHNAYLPLVVGEVLCRHHDRQNLFSATAAAMRRIFIDQARRKYGQKWGGRVEWGEPRDLAALKLDAEPIALDEALEKLAEVDPVKANLVELRYSAELDGGQAAEVLGFSPSTTARHWVYARAWLQAGVRGGRHRRHHQRNASRSYFLEKTCRLVY
ncbi:MAG: ECF-type sigma factor [Thermoguttaceae bacterium]